VSDPLSLVFLAALSSRVEIPAAGAASPRPELCRPRQHDPGAGSLWTRARPEGVVRYCGALARGYARLASNPSEALALARSARPLAPAEVGARLLEGRALLRLGHVAEAWKQLEPFAAVGTLDDAPSLHDVARAALAAGALDTAERTYRVLVPRAGLLGSSGARRIAYVEAASLLIARGERSLDEALGYLAEARAIPLSGDRDLVLGLTALALSRAGRAEQARAVARETEGPWDLEAELSPAERQRVADTSFGSDTPEDPAPAAALAPRRVMLLEGELHAAIAVLAEGRDAALRRAHWRAFLASPAGKGAWAEHAKKALAGRGGG
jgi:tetratricopeptide (TPR) repeat protein